MNTVHLYVDNPTGSVDLRFPLEGSWSIALKEICYVVGYYNISAEKGNQTVGYERLDGDWRKSVPDGLYSLPEYINEAKRIVGPGLAVVASPYNGKATVSVAKATALTGFRDAHGILGISDRLTVAAGEEVVGSEPVDLLSPKQLFVHCPQIKGDLNLYNGSPSKILEVLPVTSAKLGYMVTQRMQNPSFKELAPQPLHSLTLEIKDEAGTDVNFHGSYIRYTLELHRQA